MKPLLTVIILLFMCNAVHAQNYVLGGGGIGFHSSMEKLNGIIDQFNLNNDHQIPDFRFVPSYEIGFARYARYTLVEIKWVGEGRRNNSKQIGNFIENATVAWRYHFVNFSFGYRPFENRFFTTGLGLNLGQMRTRFSFGGDFEVVNRIYALSSDFFVDYAVKVKWRKNKQHYLFRIRPFYQFFYFPLDLKELEEKLNSNPVVEFNELLQSFNNFGIRLSLLIPITGKIQKH